MLARGTAAATSTPTTARLTMYTCCILDNMRTSSLARCLQGAASLRDGEHTGKENTGRRLSGGRRAAHPGEAVPESCPFTRASTAFANASSLPLGIVAPAAAWCPPPSPPNCLEASRITAARSSPRATSSRGARALTFTPSGAYANAIRGIWRFPLAWSAIPAAMPTTVSRILSSAWKYWIPSSLAADPVRDLGGVVPPARVDQRAELLRVPRRAPDRLPDEGVDLADESLRLPPSAPAADHVPPGVGDYPPLLPRVEFGPCAPGVLDLQVDPDFQEEGDARLPVPAEPRDPRVRGILEHLVDGAGQRE